MGGGSTGKSPISQSGLSRERYGEMVKKATPNTRLASNCLKAFLVGGLICGLAQFYSDYIKGFGFTADETAAITVVTLIFVAAVLTGMGVYDKLGNFAGAGSIVPITGFSNSVAAPAIEFKKEGFIFGVGAKMFAIAGPVIVYGTLTSVAVGLVYYVINTFF